MQKSGAQYVVKFKEHECEILSLKQQLESQKSIIIKNNKTITSLTNENKSLEAKLAKAITHIDELEKIISQKNDEIYAASKNPVVENYIVLNVDEQETNS